tara:strand:+ start:426 stop:539 length:114 start_codon:yes stop_codon:yes gene_type:complete
MGLPTDRRSGKAEIIYRHPDDAALIGQKLNLDFQIPT